MFLGKSKTIGKYLTTDSFTLLTKLVIVQLGWISGPVGDFPMNLVRRLLALIIIAVTSSSLLEAQEGGMVRRFL